MIIVQGKKGGMTKTLLARSEWEASVIEELMIAEGFGYRRSYPLQAPEPSEAEKEAMEASYWRSVSQA